MKFLRKFCASLIVLTLMGFSTLAQDQQDKTPPKKEKPKAEVVPKNDNNQNRDRDSNNDNKRGDNGNKKPGEEV